MSHFLIEVFMFPLSGFDSLSCPSEISLFLPFGFRDSFFVDG